MHEPLPREFRTNAAPIGALGLVWACALVVLVAVDCVAIAAFGGGLTLRGARIAGPPTLKSSDANEAAAYITASSSSDLFSNMPQP